MLFEFVCDDVLEVCPVVFPPIAAMISSTLIDGAFCNSAGKVLPVDALVVPPSLLLVFDKDEELSDCCLSNKLSAEPPPIAAIISSTLISGAFCSSEDKALPSEAELSLPEEALACVALFD